jgi:Insertion domain in 60S ribosomal protein L10P
LAKGINANVALGVPTKIARGTIEIVIEVHLVHKDTKVGASEATLLNMLNISPFTYGMVVQQVYDNGNVFAPSILDIEEDSLLAYFTAAIRNVASVSLATDYPTLVSVTHSLVNSYKNLLAISVETEYDFEGSEKVLAPSPFFLPFFADENDCVLSDLREWRTKSYSNFLLRRLPQMLTVIFYGHLLMIDQSISR